MEVKHLVYLSLGSNMGNRLMHLQKAIFELDADAGAVVKVSPIYENPAMGFEGDDFLNICVGLETVLDPFQLLNLLLKIELDHGRERFADGKYTSRPLDIDIIYYDQYIIDEENLIVPHPHMPDRKFVLKPLADIAPQFYHPGSKKDTRNLLQESRDKTKLAKLDKKLFRNRKELFARFQFLTIEGTIGAGKTSLTQKIAEDLNGKLILERFADNPFLPKFYEDQSRYAFPLEMSFLADRYQQFTEDIAQFDLFKDFIISDYDVSKSLIFGGITLQQEEFELYRKLFNLMHKEIKKPEVYFYLYQNTDRLLENIAKRGRSYEKNIERDYLEKINAAYLNYLKTIPEANKLIINVEQFDFVENQADYDTMLGIMEEKLIANIFFT
ncbi:2-amino-4-hydroxy-6-hydroxymethyldihydropteridine diphosphokinase [Croceivirga thetidis]|uniref:2-amino-4-hydroxy-6-hydroxymethyldihydropteridine pyrophosphokinase n=1 Tax=Croceivirga thetidis TaxID=2721623 RepID=A0ABX1GL45_9FLAO|nr:2-amino-4-hydroxy-6-hydroxymethyldihydropteridine diphosphokinase [Croceivirga thetidis]NKI30583.1 2-amino-4-hydroxy-6-hydroxymethyldihydropteridine diphosphokinase [Croceivirga thetidis]